MQTLSFSGPRSIDIDEVRTLAQLTLRLEAMCSALCTSLAPQSPVVPLSSGLESNVSKRSQQNEVKSMIPSYLGPAIREEMHDEELSMIIDSLTTRIENCVSTMVCRLCMGKRLGLTDETVFQATRRILVSARGARTGNADRSEVACACDVADERGDEAVSNCA